MQVLPFLFEEGIPGLETQNFPLAIFIQLIPFLPIIFPFAFPVRLHEPPIHTYFESFLNRFTRYEFIADQETFH